MNFKITLFVTLLLTTGCSTYSAHRYAVSTDNVIAVRSFKGASISVGHFTAAPGIGNEIMCRGVGPIKTPDKESYQDYIRKALVDELRMAEVYSENGAIKLTGHLQKIDFTSQGGHWDISINVKSSQGADIDVSETYPYESSFYGETACNQTAQALMPAVQDLIGKIVKSSEFAKMVKPEKIAKDKKR